MKKVRTWAVALTGLRAEIIEVHADVAGSAPDLKVSGVPEHALSDTRHRVLNACWASAAIKPERGVAVSLEPVALRKQGAGFDLAIAVASLAARGVIDDSSIAGTVHLGQLDIDGRLRPVPGVLPAVYAAAVRGFTDIIVPAANLAEARLVRGIHARGAVSLAEVMRWHGADVDVPDVSPVQHLPGAPSRAAQALELADVVGQPEAVEGLIVAAAGGHNLLVTGPAGSGKTMLVNRLQGILPDLDEATALEVAWMRSVASEPVSAIDRTPPFEAPDHSASIASLIGGGSRTVQPGAIPMANGGVLFIDDASDVPPGVLDTLRQPLEQGRLEVHRAGLRVSFPAKIQLALALRGCPCGEFGVSGGSCDCPPSAIRRHRARISGPLMDRMDVRLTLTPHTAAAGATGTVTTAEARERVGAARERAAARLQGTPWSTNAEVAGAWLRQGPVAIDADARRVLDVALQRGEVTLRGYDRVLRIAWTLADLAGRDEPRSADIDQALTLRDRSINAIPK